MSINGLYQIIKDKERILTTDIDGKYLTDNLGRIKGSATAVVFPLSAGEVSNILKYAHANDIPVTPRGAGTNLVGSTVPDGGIVLDMSRMNRILELDRNTLSVTVEPGVLLKDLQEFVEEAGFLYPPDPGEKTATIGGNISTNAGGMRAVKYGVTRDYVLGLEVVLANGEILTLGSKNIKDSTGLSIKNLIIGSEGTLAVVTKCVLKILPKPEASVSVLIPYSDLENGIENVVDIIHSSASPTAIEFIERKVIKLGEDFLQMQFPYPDAAAYILLTFDGALAEVSANTEKARQAARQKSAKDFMILDEKTAADVWKIRGALVKAVEAVSEQEPVDIVVPIDKTAEFIAFVNELSAKTGLQMIAFGHAGDGNVHLCVVRGARSDEEWETDLKSNMQRLYQKAYELGGLTSGEHGIGLTKKPYFFQNTDKANLALMNKIKDAFDEKHILNTHKVYLK
jgi:glycolate oxidase